MMFPGQKSIQNETILCYIDYKAWRFSPIYSAAYILLVAALAYVTNCFGKNSYPNIYFNVAPFIFAGGILWCIVALILYTLKNAYVWAGSFEYFQERYAIGMLVQDFGIVCIHGAVALSFYARCKAGDCADEKIPFCNPEHDIDAYPFGHGQFILMLPLLTRVLLNNNSFLALAISWAMSFSGLLVSMVVYKLSHGTVYYLGHSTLVLFTIYTLEALNFERYELCLRTGISPSEEADIDHTAKLVRTGSGPRLLRAGSFSSNASSVPSNLHPMPKPLLGVPYVFINDLLAPSRFLRDSTKSLIQLVSALDTLNSSKEDNPKKAAMKPMQMTALLKKMDMVLNQSFVCSTLVCMQMNLTGDAIKKDSMDVLRPKAQSINLPNILMDCITIAKAMQKVVNVNVLFAPKASMIASVLGDTDWVSECMQCMICNAVRMSGPKGIVNIAIDIIEESKPVQDNGKMMKIDDLEKGQAATVKMLRIMVDTDAVSAVKNGMSHPVDILAPWVEYMNKDQSDGRLIATRDGDSSARPIGSATQIRSSNIHTIGGKKCHNGAAGISMRGVASRSEALDGSYSVQLGRIPSKGKNKPDKPPEQAGKIDFNNHLSVNGGCYFLLTIPYKPGAGLPTVSSKMSIKPTALSAKPSKSKVMPASNAGRNPNGNAGDNRGVYNNNATNGRNNNPATGPPRGGDTDIHGRNDMGVKDGYRREQKEKEDYISHSVNNNHNGRRNNGDSNTRRGDYSSSPVRNGMEDRFGPPVEQKKSRRKPPPKFDVAPSKLVMQVANRFDRKGNYGLSDSDSDDNVELDVRDGRGAEGRGRLRPPQIQGYEDNRRPHGGYPPRPNDFSPPKHNHANPNSHTNAMRRSPDSQYQDQASNYRDVISELNSAQWRGSHENGGHRLSHKKTSFNSPSSLDQMTAVDEAIDMLTKAKEKFTSNGNMRHMNSGQMKMSSSNGLDGGNSPFAIKYNTKPQSVLLIIPGNITDAKDSASDIISGLKDAGKEVQLESNFVYALNMVLSGASFDAIIMDISQCNSFEATEFVRRLRAWENTLVKQGGKEAHQFLAAFTLDDLVITADNELHGGVDTLIAPPVKVTAIMDILNIIKILSVS